ncbi:hypothetical protein ETB97_003887 [Aspergillus alliaceus]|uniref:Homeobox and C2H2 transcription factor n=1 Tax=Petromyces alliaceus TaxID=209559 RepID=A0A8H6A0K2_PETAA|nr:hypothetical protein ETB97_003887 [Aspergillus burnettii]
MNGVDVVADLNLLTLDQFSDCKDRTRTGDLSETVIEKLSAPVALDSHDSNHRTGSARFSRETVRILKTWFNEHIEYPYPTEEEMRDLKRQTGLKSMQIRTWFANARRRDKVRSVPPCGPSPSPIGAINIPGQHSISLMTPLERWKYSPPENEPAATINIIRALSERPSESHPILPPHTSHLSSHSSEHGLTEDSNCDISGVFPAPSVSSVDTGRSSTSNFSSKSAFSHGSSAGMGPEKRKGRRRRQHRKPTNFANTFAQNKTRAYRRFQCTFCADSFSTKYDWQRHEKSLHLPLETWNCSPFGGIVPLNGKTVCAFCLVPDADNNHLHSHNYLSCQEKDPRERTFYRKDHLNQHLRFVHNVKFNHASMGSWKSSITDIKSRCGFCDAGLSTWDGRVAHLAEHFKNGADMRQWQGDWGFEPSVQSRVANAMPPYLNGQERLTMNPYTANATNDLELSAESNQPMLQDQEDANSWRRLQQELTAYIKRQLEIGVIPTDAMMQDHARVVIYGCDDPWNQTCADNPVWLSFLKRDNGLEAVPDSDFIQLDNLGMQPPFALNGGLQLPPLETNTTARTIYSRELRKLHSSNWETQGLTYSNVPHLADKIANSHANASDHVSGASVPSLSTDWGTNLSTDCSSSSMFGDQITSSYRG